MRIFLAIISFISFFIFLSSSVIYSQPTFHGSSQLIYNYNSLPLNSQQLPPAYMLWSGNQQIGWQGLPFEISWNLSTANPYDHFVPNAFSIRFDAEKFKADLRKRAEQQLKSEYLEKLQNKIKYEEIKAERTAIKNFFSSQQVKEQMKLISEYDSINNILHQKKTRTENSETESLNRRLEALSVYAANREAFEELQKKEKELDSLEKILPKDTVSDSFQYDNGRLRDPSKLKKELQQRGMLSRAENIGMWMDKLQAGRFSPCWSEQTLRGVTMDGVELALAPGNVYAGLIAGTLYPWQMLGLPAEKRPFPRQVIGAKAGYGSENTSHIRMHVLQFKDYPGKDQALYFPSPKANYLLNLSGEWHALHERLLIKAAITGSQTSNTVLQNSEPLVQSQQITIPAPDSPSQWFENILYQKKNSLSFSTDKALEATLRYSPFAGGPTVSTELKQIGTYFQSFGVPFLPTDFRMVKAGLEQPLYKNKIHAIGNFSIVNDNLSGQKKYTSYWNNYMAGLRFQPVQPLQISLALRTVQQAAPVRYLYHFATAQASYFYLKNFWKTMATINTTAQLPGLGVSTYSIMAGSDVTSPAGHRLSASVTNVFTGSNSIVSFQCTPQYLLLKKWSNGIGVSYYTSSGIYIQKGVHYETQLKLSEKLSFSLRADFKRMENYTANFLPGQGNQWFLSSRLVALW